MSIDNILIVDDDEEDSEFFTTVLSEINPEIKVTVAASKEQLFDYLKTLAPDMLFIDSFIQHQSGLESIEEIRTDPALEKIPVIMYTGSADMKNITNAFKVGASAYIVKPQTLSEIKSALQVVLYKDWSEDGTQPKQYYMNQKFSDFKGN